MKKKHLFLAVIISFNIAFVASAKPIITVAAAANVQYAMSEIKTEFQKETGIEISVIIGSSGQLTAQIKEGAPFDIFISADMKYPNTLYKEGIAIDTPSVYAYGSLVIWTMNKNFKFDKRLKILLDKNIKKIALANPKTAPYGVASVEALKKFGIYNEIKDKLVYGESISPTNQYIVSRAADAGFTAKSVVLSPQMKGKGFWIAIEKSAYKPIKQGCVILKYGYRKHRTASKKFYDFLFSKKGKKILSSFGYIVEN